jgi:hypothetical protein
VVSSWWGSGRKMENYGNAFGEWQAKSGALSRGFSREEGIEHFLLYVGRNAGAVVANPDLYAVAEVLGGSRKSGLIAFAIILLFALGRRIEAVGDQVQVAENSMGCRNGIGALGRHADASLHRKIFWCCYSLQQ